ncbi:720_t:CDS:2 [Ambispora gerdemannii]|uniref:720_t:CDS:1 n=1 Tax=Ambispora gerdemannii TaxID=144530 RepID=A0A9N9CEC8_9GLOM|nr:720_t:CDS:2 [Ambispora gerdemannii]
MSFSPSKNPQPSKPKSALDVVVNQLVRASLGGVPSSLPDEDLDKYVADLILKEAAAKNKLFNKEGIRAYLPNTGVPPCNLPKPNKRFLFNIVKSVDDHNQALIRKEEEEAAKRHIPLVNRSRLRESESNDSSSSLRGYRQSRRPERLRHGKNIQDLDESDQYSSSSERGGGSFDEPKRKKSRHNQSSAQDSLRGYQEDEYYINKDKYHHRRHSDKSSSEQEHHTLRQKRSRKRNHSVENFSRSSSIESLQEKRKEYKTKSSSLSYTTFNNNNSLTVSSLPSSSSQSHKYHSAENSGNESNGKHQLVEMAETASIYKDTSIKVVFKGRGETSNGSKMDKYFRKDYDPMHDVEPFLGDNGCSDKSKRKHKTRESSDSYDSNDDSDYSTTSVESDERYVKSKNSRRKRHKKDGTESGYKGHHKKTTAQVVREWDMPKLATGSWYSEKTS